MTTARAFVPSIYNTFTRPVISIRPVMSVQEQGGNDERFPYHRENNNEEKYRICLFIYYLEQIRMLEKWNISNLERPAILRDMFDNITPIKMKAGGLMDDWERNDLESGHWERDI